MIEICLCIMSHSIAYNFKPVTHYQFKSHRIWNAMIDGKAGKGTKSHTRNSMCTGMCVCVPPMNMAVLTNEAIWSIHFLNFLV